MQTYFERRCLNNVRHETQISFNYFEGTRASLVFVSTDHTAH